MIEKSALSTLTLAQLTALLNDALKSGANRPVYLMDPANGIRMPVSKASIEITTDAIQIWAATQSNGQGSNEP